MSELLNHPAVVSAISVVVTMIIIGVVYLIRKKMLSIDTVLPTVQRVIEAILGASRYEHPALQIEKEIKNIPSAEMAKLAKKLATDNPVQKVYDIVTEPARRAGEQDGSGWLKNLATGLGRTAMTGLAQGLAKKLF
ncbi:hypothetical protein [Maridesulfovibrio ferrireducens]|uniref:hypothetical protein n=1 Tax=Maridesulfovibrio ferrireducens TaxID=246191 RepID=UPI001A207BF2|nr:hypothetical protein [Maridesulfovibrio ferrireducens]MBI9113216.1 hypothetical protein [Maridesulfovibrio ferrireducens]